jgi:hypothetical protein
MGDVPKKTLSEQFFFAAFEFESSTAGGGAIATMISFVAEVSSNGLSL